LAGFSQKREIGSGSDRLKIKNQRPKTKMKNEKIIIFGF